MSQPTPAQLGAATAPGPSADDRSFAARIVAGFDHDDIGRRRSCDKQARIDSCDDADWFLAGGDIHQLAANATTNCWAPMVRTRKRRRTQPHGSKPTPSP